MSYAMTHSCFGWLQRRQRHTRDTPTSGQQSSVARWWTAGVMAMAVAGCGGAAEQTEAQTPDDLPTGVAQGADLSRCEYKDRDDRVFSVTTGPGARRPNVMRIYQVSARGDDAARTLICRRADSNLDGIADLIRTYNDDGEPMAEQADSDYDGRIDTWVQFSRGRVLSERFDRNGDGKPDELRTYSNGVLTRVQRDSDFDDNTDTWEVHDKGRLQRIGRDVNADERVDEWYRDAQAESRDAKQSSTNAPASTPSPSSNPKDSEAEDAQTTQGADAKSAGGGQSSESTQSK